MDQKPDLTKIANQVTGLFNDNNLSLHEGLTIALSYVIAVVQEHPAHKKPILDMVQEAIEKIEKI